MRMGAVDFFTHHKALIGMALLILLSVVLKQLGISWLDPEIIVHGVSGLMEEKADACADAQAHWQSAEKDGSLAAFKAHLAHFPNCSFADLAKLRIQELGKSSASTSDPSEADRKLLGDVYQSAGPQVPSVLPNETDEELVRRVYRNVGTSNGTYIPLQPPASEVTTVAPDAQNSDNVPPDWRRIK
jgi:hypothetical protein